jgi:hypothetical protein
VARLQPVGGLSPSVRGPFRHGDDSAIEGSTGEHIRRFDNVAGRRTIAATFLEIRRGYLSHVFGDEAA